MLDEQSLPVAWRSHDQREKWHVNSGQILLMDGDLLLKLLGVGRELLQQVLLRPNLLTGVVLSAGLPSCARQGCRQPERGVHDRSFLGDWQELHRARGPVSFQSLCRLVLQRWIGAPDFPG